MTELKLGCHTGNWRVQLDVGVCNCFSVLCLTIGPIGMCQGSMLGPILFMVYVDDTDDEIVGNIVKFASDAQLFSVADNIEDI